MSAVAAPPLLGRPEEVAALVRDLAGVPEVALDCEGDSLHHYGEKLCLMQITVPGGSDVLVDPLAPGLDLAPLLGELSVRTLLLHGGDYDLRLLGLGHGFRAGSIFDTVTAAQYLGDVAFGLAAIVEREFGVVLDKAMQKADWSARPLTERMRVYAALDTHFLPELASRFRERLAEKGRLGWHRQACERIASAVPTPREADPENDWRIKGSRELAPRELAVLREAWAFREEEARRRDVPPFRVAAGELLLRVAKRAVAEPEADLFAGWKGMVPGAVRRGFAASAERARALPEAEWPSRLPKKPFARPDPAVEARAAKLREKRDAIAKELEIDPAVIAPRGALEAIAAAEAQDAPGMREAGRLLPWQAELLSR